MTDIEKIKAEIERQVALTNIGISECDKGVEKGRKEVLNALRDFVNSLPEENVPEIDFVKFDNKRFCSVFGYGKENEALNQEITTWQDYFCRKNDLIGRELIKQVAQHFAQWQQEQMLNVAVDAYPVPHHYEYDSGKEMYNAFALEEYLDGEKYNLHDGDKVKLVIIKADENG